MSDWLLLSDVGAKKVWKLEPKFKWQPFRIEFDKPTQNLDKLTQNLDKPTQSLEKSTQSLDKPTQDLDKPTQFYSVILLHNN